MTTGTSTYRVPAISCDHCVAAITEQVTAVDGVEGVQVDLDAKIVTVVGGDGGSIVAAIDHAGYDTE